MDETVVIRCDECLREVDEFTAIAKQWVFWSDGRDLVPYCLECYEREFGREARKPAPLVHPRPPTNVIEQRNGARS